ncbi:hypothetical protein F0562_011697 [Nyssa sinensis]|uniref:Aspartic peptidase DDI1-type domain-containing protein n=1 Tax=Nyssa sinensis TaxID=561372 RepID=A0A5J4ZQP1_9ASTE|nr:hypothetical protein F0562_011697 [Nyssa sinensis]
MRMTAKIGSHEVIMLVDSGSTHNFVSERIARLLRMPVVPTEPFTVRVANGENMKCQGRVGSGLGDPMARNVGFSNLQLGKTDHGVYVG